jgi:hypothetical protein
MTAHRTALPGLAGSLEIDNNKDEAESGARKKETTKAHSPTTAISAFHLILLEYKKQKQISTMAGNASNQRIIPLEEGWNDEIKAKVRSTQDP